jgi:hypothetical protein
LAKSAVDVISSAFEHTKQQLTQPFRFGQWTRLAVLALATGELSSGGGCGNTWGRLGSLAKPNHSQNFVDPADLLRSINPALIGSLVLLAVVSGLILMLIWIYVSSISRFILFESVLRKHCDSFGVGWNRWHSRGMSFFWWQLGLAILGLVVMAVLLLPLLLPLLAAMRAHQQPGPGILLAFLPMLLIFGIFSLVMLCIAVLAKDFVVPLMALEGIGVLDGWRRLLDMVKAEKGSYAGYLGMKVVLAIGAGVLFTILSTIAAMFVVVPVGIVAVVLVIVAKGAGLAWNPVTITAAIVAGTIVIVLLLCVIAFVNVPVAVFFPAYAMYFLAERFPALRAQLYPVPPTLPQAPAVPPFSPPPEPIG